MSTRRFVVAPAESLPSGSSKIVEVAGRSIGLINVDGRIYALRNGCPHRGAPLCLGKVKGTMLSSEPHEYVYSEEPLVVSCPWHHYEFRLDNGESVHSPKTLRVKTYKAGIEGQDVVVYV